MLVRIWKNWNPLCIAGRNVKSFDTYYNVNEPWKHFAEGRLLYDYTYMQYVVPRSETNWMAS